MSQPTPSRLPKAAATAAAVVATTAALTAGVASSAPEALAAHNRSVQTEVELTADAGRIPDIVGLYGVGPIFWTAQALGITPENVIAAAGGLTGNTALADTVIGLLDLLDAVSPIAAGVKGPLPGDVYGAVNGLDYTVTGLAGMLGIREGSLMDKFIEWVVEGAPILNQRRSIILSESLGGLTTSLGYRDMIDAVTSDSDDWGVGITGQWLIMVNNVSRPGGGLLALATPLTNLFGLNLTTPDAGSYTNPDKTKVLNTSILDITWAYNPLSDVPTTLNPLAWANSAAAGVFLTYLLPDEGNNIGNHVLPKLIGGIADGVKVMIDPTGGQGAQMIPIAGDLLKWLGVNFLDFPGTATYITYDSGNLPLLEPFRMVPHLANLVPGVDIPTPLTDSVEDALRKMVNMGYQDVNPVDLERTFGEAGEQAYFWHSPLTPTQQLAANQTIFNALIDGIQDNALNPEAWTPKLPGANFKPIVQNALTVAAMKALSDALEAVQDGANPMFDAVEKGLAPVTSALDGVNAQVETAIDNMLKVKEPTTNKLAPKQAVTSVPSGDSRLRALDVEATTPQTDTDADAEAQTESKPAPVRNVLKDLGVDKDSLKIKAESKSRARHAADAKDPIKKSVKDTVAKAREATTDTTDKAAKAEKKVQKAAKDAAGGMKKDKSAKTQSKSQKKQKSAA